MSSAARVKREKPVTRGLKATKAKKASRARRVKREKPVPRVLRVRKANKVSKALRVKRVIKVKTEKMERPG